MIVRSSDLRAVAAAEQPKGYPSSPDAVLSWVREQRRQHDIVIVWKRIGRMSVAFQHVIFLDRDSWDAKGDIDRAAHLVHELTHALRDFSRIWYGFGRLGERTRWREETIAFREQARALRAMGVSRETIKRWARQVTDDYQRDYLIRGDAAAQVAYDLITRAAA